MIVPSHETDAAPPDRGCQGLVFLAGAIKYWWLKKCDRCGHVAAEDARYCPNCDWTGIHEIWGTKEHHDYTRWRDDVRHWLIAEGYLTYAPHMAFKGTWLESAQAVNDAAIAASDLMLVLSPPGIPTEGTDDEVDYARKVGTPVFWLPPGSGESRLHLAISSLMIQKG